MYRNSQPCEGEVLILRGQTVALTGKVLLNGEHVTRKNLARILESHGVHFKTDVTGQISLLVHGDLSGQAVTDRRLELSKKLLNVLNESGHGHHICVISSTGLSSLMTGGSARCFNDYLIRLAANHDV